MSGGLLTGTSSPHVRLTQSTSMPDWSYQTVFRPVLFRMPPERGRDLALGAMGRLSRIPFGTTAIALLGHMRPDCRLRVQVGGFEFPSRAGIGAILDSRLLAPRALSQFGAGFLEIGPVSSTEVQAGAIQRDEELETLTFHSPAGRVSLATAAREVEAIRNVPILVRLSDQDRDSADFLNDAMAVIARLGGRAAGFVIDLRDPASSKATIEALSPAIRAHGQRLVLLAISADHLVPLFTPSMLLAACINGFVLEGCRRDNGGHLTIGRALHQSTVESVARLRNDLPAQAMIIAAGGVHEPAQALELVAAGADLVRIDSGLVFSGPGLVKRTNEALLFQQLRSSSPASTFDSPRLARMSWFWTLLMGLAMFVGGLMAMTIAATRIVMPYDEAALGMNRRQIVAVNDNLLHFMQHDRMTLAGTMLAVGVLYVALSAFGSRFGMHWAHVAIAASAFVGFASFFLFLGFGYFDPFHAFVTAVLLQLLLLAIHSDLPPAVLAVPPELTNDQAWRRSQWGQLLFIVHGAVLIAAGIIISWFGITSVFVPEDLEFMNTTAEHLTSAHPQLVPLVAHDRATFGGMLQACGVCVLLSSLWGFRRGNFWLWWALMAAGSVAYVATIAVHWHVGYTSLKHLLPAYGGLMMLLAGGALSREHLCRVQ